MRGGVATQHPSSTGTRGRGLRETHVIHLLQLSSVRWKCSKMNLLWVLKPNNAPAPFPHCFPSIAFFSTLINYYTLSLRLALKTTSNQNLIQRKIAFQIFMHGILCIHVWLCDIQFENIFQMFSIPSLKQPVTGCLPSHRSYIKQNVTCLYWP